MKIHLLDIGSTSVKHCVWADGVKREAGSLPFPDPLPGREPYYEVSPDRIMEVIYAGLGPVEPGDQIVMSVQMHGYLLAEADGRLLTPYISWRDRRSELLPDSLRYPFDMPAWCGVSAKPNLPLAGLVAIRALQPELFRKAKRFYTLGTYVTSRLTGLNVGHITDLAPTGAYDGRTGERRAIDFVHEIMFPVAVGWKPVGRFRGADVWPAVGDQQASVAGSDLRQGEYLINLGTAAQVCTLSRQAVYGDFESRPYLDGRTLCTVTGLTGGKDYPALASDPAVSACRLAAEYGAALGRLPPCDSLRVMGGVCRHYRALLEETLCQLGIPWTIDDEADALKGLLRAYEGRIN